MKNNLPRTLNCGHYLRVRFTERFFQLDDRFILPFHKRKRTRILLPRIQDFISAAIGAVLQNKLRRVWRGARLCELRAAGWNRAAVVRRRRVWDRNGFGGLAFETFSS
jgi:hypothetical protein